MSKRKNKHVERQYLLQAKLQKIVDQAIPDLLSQLEERGFEKKWAYITEKMLFVGKSGKADPGEVYVLDSRVDGLWHAHLLDLWLVEDLTSLSREGVEEANGLPVVIEVDGHYYVLGFDVTKVAEGSAV